MEDGQTATILGMLYPFLVIIFWAFVMVALVWGVIKLVKKLRSKNSK